MPLYFKEIGLSGSEIGWLLAIGPIAAIISQPIWGFISDKYKSIRKTLFICLTGSIVFCLVLFWMDTFLGYMITLFIFFFFLSTVMPLGDSLAKQTSEEERVPFGNIRLWGSFGYGFSALVFGYVLTGIGVDKVIYPILLFLIITIINCFFLKDVKSSNKPVKLIDAVKLGMDPRFLVFLIIVMFISTTHRTNDNFLGLYIIELGGSETLIGVATFIGVVTECLVMALAFFWFKRFHETTFIIIAGVIYSIRWFLMAVITDPIMVLYLQLLHGVSFGIFYLAAFQYVTKLLPNHLQATGHVLFITFLFGISGIVGSLIGGSIIEQSSLADLYVVIGYLSGTGAILFIGYRMYFLQNRNSLVGQKEM